MFRSGVIWYMEVGPPPKGYNRGFAGSSSRVQHGTQGGLSMVSGQTIAPDNRERPRGHRLRGSQADVRCAIKKITSRHVICCQHMHEITYAYLAIVGETA